MDNDGDGKTDCADSDCSASCPSPNLVIEAAPVIAGNLCISQPQTLTATVKNTGGAISSQTFSTRFQKSVGPTTLCEQKRTGVTLNTNQTTDFSCTFTPTATGAVTLYAQADRSDTGSENDRIAESNESDNQSLNLSVTFITSPSSAPANMRHNSNTETSITWAWDAVSGATSYNLYKSDDGIEFGSDGSTSSTSKTQTTDYPGGAMAANTKYYYKTRTVNTCGSSGDSTVTSAYTAIQSATGASFSGIGQTSFTVAPTGTINVPNPNTGSYTSYIRFELHNGSDSGCNQALLQDSGWKNTASHSFSGLTQNTTYKVCIETRNGDGDTNAETGMYSVTTTAADQPDLTVPSSPSISGNLCVGQAQTFTSTVRNIGPGNANGTISVPYKEGANTLCTGSGSINLNQNQETNNFSCSYTPSSAGTVLVNATADSTGVIAESNESNNVSTNLSVTFITTPGAAGTPTFSSVGPTSVTVSWSAGTNATTYNLYRCTGSGCTPSSQLASNVTSPYTDSTVSEGTTYGYQVRDSNSCGAGPNSGTGYANTPTFSLSNNGPVTVNQSGGTQDITVTVTSQNSFSAVVTLSDNCSASNLSCSYPSGNSCTPLAGSTCTRTLRIGAGTATPGAKTVAVTGTAASYANKTTNVSVTVADNVAPTCGTTTYNPSALTNGNVTVTIPCTDNTNGSGCVQANYTTTISANGSGTLTIADNAGNSNATCNYNVTNIDKTAPTISVFTVDGTSYGASANNNDGSPNISWTSSDGTGSGVNNVKIWRAPDSGGVPGAWTNVNTSSSASGSWSDSVSNGTYWYGLHSTDNATNCIKGDTSGADKGHCGGVASDTLDTRIQRDPIRVVVNVACPLPTYTVTDGVNATYNTSDTVALTWTGATSPTGTWGFSANATCDGTDSYPNSGNSTTVSTTHTDYLCFRNNNACGTTYASQGPLRVDTGLPTASFTVAPASGTVNVTSFAVDATASSDNLTSAANLEVRWDWEADGTYDTSYSTTKTSSHIYSTTGAKTIRLQVRDQAGNANTTTQSVTVNTAADTTPPTVSSPQARPDSYTDTGEWDNDTTIYFTFTATDDVGVTACNTELNDASPDEPIADLANRQDTDTGIEGANTYYVQCQDAAGNTSIVQSDTIGIDTTLSTVTTFTVENTAAGGSIVISTSGEKPTVRWNTSDSGSNINHVELWRADYNATNCRIGNISGCSWSEPPNPIFTNTLASNATGVDDISAANTNNYMYGFHVVDNAGNCTLENGQNCTGGTGNPVYVDMNIAGADFSLSLSPASSTVTQGTNATYSIAVTPSGGFSSSVGTWVSTNCPAGAACSIAPASCASASYASCATLTVTTGSVSPNTYSNISVTGTGNSLTRTSNTVSLIVNSPANQNPNTSSLSQSPGAEGSTTNDPTPTLTFTISDPDSGNTVKYQIQVDNNSDFSSPAVDYTSALMANPSPVNYTTTSLGDNSWYWRVRATDNNNATSGWADDTNGFASTGIDFSIDTTAPDITPPTVTVTGAPASWQNTSASACLSCSDAGSGCNANRDTLNLYSSNPGTCPTTYNAAFAYTVCQTVSSQQWVCGYGEDNAAPANTDTDGPIEFRVDLLSPTITSFTVEDTAMGATFTITGAAQKPTAKWNTSDASSQVASVQLWRADVVAGTCVLGNLAGCGWTQVLTGGASNLAGLDDASANNPEDYIYGIHIVDNAGNCVLENGQPCVGGTGNPVHIIMNIPSPLSASFTSCRPDPAGAPDTVRFTNTTSGGALPYSYTWNFGDGSANSSLTDPTHNFTTGATSLLEDARFARGWYPLQKLFALARRTVALLIPPVKLARAQAGIAHEGTVTGTVLASNAVTTGTVTAAANQLYLAAITTRPHVTVSSVTGIGLTWTRVKDQCSGNMFSGIEVWKAQGTPSGNGTVTANLPSSVNAAVIAVSRYSGVDPANAVGNVVGADTLGTNDTVCSGGVDSNSYSANITTTAANHYAYGAVAIRNRAHTPGAVPAAYTERTEVTAGSSGNIARLAVEDRGVASASTIPVNGTLGGTTDWAMIGVEIKAASGGGGPPYTVALSVTDGASGSSQSQASITPSAVAACPANLPPSKPTITPPN